MKRFNYLWLSCIALIITLSSCQVAGGIFKAGFYTAIIVVILVVGLIIWLFSRRK